MESTSIIALTKRIEHLEHQNYLWKWGAMFLLTVVVVFSIGMAGAKRSVDVAKVLEVEKLLIRDQNGNERVKLGVGSNGVAYLSLQADGGIGGIDLVASAKEQSHLDIWNKTMGHLMLMTAPDRKAADFLDANRVGQIALKIEKDDTQYLSFL